MTDREDHSMIKADQRDELATLAHARAGLSPSPADALRVRASLAAALPAPGAVAPDAAPAGWGRSVGTGEGWSLRAVVASVAVAAMGAGAGGYWMGHRAGAREARLAAGDAVTRQSESVPPSTSRVVAGEGAPSLGPLPSPAPVGEAATGKEAVRRRPANVGRSGRPASIASPAEGLGQEVRALRAVEHALREDDPRLALAILQQLDRDVPKGQLVEERRATSVIARCSAGDVPFGIDLAGDFAGDYPESVYLGRVEQSCRRGARSK